MPAPLIGKTPSGRREMSRIATEGGRPLAGRASPAVRTGPIGRKAAGPVLIGSSICIAAVNLDSGAQPFPIAKTSLVQHSRYRLASGSPTRGAGAKRLRGCAISHVSVPYPGCWKAILRTTSPSPSVTPLLVGEALAFRRLRLFGRGFILPSADISAKWYAGQAPAPEPADSGSGTAEPAARRCAVR